MEIKEVKVEAFSDDDGSKNSLEFGHETVEVADIKREIVWEGDSEIESKKRTGLQVSENPDGISIFVKEEKSVKNEYEDGKIFTNDEEIMTSIITDPLEMQNDSSSNAPSKSSPRKGKRKHLAEKLHKCGQCSYSTASKTNLTTHLITHEEEKPYKCEECDYSAAQKGHLTRHKMKHSGEKPLKCDQCDYSAARKDHLTRHKMTHSGEKPLKCDQCDYSTADKFYLTKHKMKHSGEKPHKCDQCGFSTTDKFYLIQHRRIHFGEKPFKCDLCGYSARAKRDLTRHKIKHSREKPYKCDQCDYSAVRKFQLIQHKTKHSGEKPYNCDQCGFSTSEKFNLTKHNEVHSKSLKVKIHKDTTKVKESKISLVTIPFNVITMLESVKEATLESKIEEENYNSGYIEDTEYNSEMEIKYERLICDESLSDSDAGEQTPAQADPVPVKSTTDSSDTGETMAACHPAILLIMEIDL